MSSSDVPARVQGSGPGAEAEGVSGLLRRAVGLGRARAERSGGSGRGSEPVWIAWGAGASRPGRAARRHDQALGGSLVSAETEAGQWAEDKALEVVVSRQPSRSSPRTGRRRLSQAAGPHPGRHPSRKTRRPPSGSGASTGTSCSRRRSETTWPRSPSRRAVDRARRWRRGRERPVGLDGRVPGLRPAKQPLYQTFVPLQPSGATSVMGVVEIDQPYSSIHDPALRLWRLLQIVLAVALVGVVLGFARSAWQHAAIGGAADGEPIGSRGRAGDARGPEARARAVDRRASPAAHAPARRPTTYPPRFPRPTFARPSRVWRSST